LDDTQVIRLYNSGLCELIGFRVWRGKNYYLIEELNGACLKLDPPNLEGQELIAIIENDDNEINAGNNTSKADLKFLKNYFSMEVNILPCSLND